MLVWICSLSVHDNIKKVVNKRVLYFTYFSSYRTREEVQEVRQNRDPIGLFKSRIISSALVTEDDLKVFISVIKSSQLSPTVEKI